MAEFGVGIDKEKALAVNMQELGVHEEDLLERFVRSSGPGGQNVNKTATCVYLKHLPTGIEVKCQAERSQALNRYRARQLVLQKIESMILGRQSREQQRIEKIRRQKRRRSRRAQLKILEAKHRHSEKKAGRGTLRDIPVD